MLIKSNSHERRALGQNAEQGGILVMAIVLVAITGVLARIASEAVGQDVRAAKIIESNAQKDDLRNLIRTRTNCALTVASANRMRPPMELQNYLLIGRNNVRIDLRPSGPMRIASWQLSIAEWNRSSGLMRIAAQRADMPSIRIDSVFPASDPLICR